MQQPFSRSSADLIRSALITGAAGLGVAGLPLAAAGAAAAHGRPAGVAGTAVTSTVEHWGTYGGGGSAGNGGSLTSPVAISVPGAIAQIGTSNSTQYALLTNGTLYAWGLGNRGQLGNGGTASSMTTAVQVKFPAGVKIASIPTDDDPLDTAMAIDTTGHAWGWGYNQQGELCLKNRQEYNTPVELPFTGVTSIAGGANHASYATSAGVQSCGQNNNGELGNGTTRGSVKPVAVKGLPAGVKVTAVVAGFGNTGALLADGRYYDWGLDTKGQLGNGTVNQPTDLPVQVTLPAAVTQVVEGGNTQQDGSTLVMLSTAALYAWGDDGSYQLGTGTKGVHGMETGPVAIMPPAGVTWKSLGTGGITSYAIATTGAVYAWGGNSYGQIGNGTKTRAQTPVKVLSSGQFLSTTSDNVAVSVTG